MDPVSVDINLLPADSIPDTVACRLNGKTGPVRQDGWIWIRSGNRVIRWKDDAAGEAVLKMMAAAGTASAGAEDPWRTLLEGGKPDACPPGMKDGVFRSVILFEAVPEQEKLLKREMLIGLAPVEQGDVITETAAGKVALIKVTSDHTDEEIREYAAAVIETVETEAGPCVFAASEVALCDDIGEQACQKRMEENATRKERIWLEIEGHLVLRSLVPTTSSASEFRQAIEKLAADADAVEAELSSDDRCLSSPGTRIHNAVFQTRDVSDSTAVSSTGRRDGGPLQ